MTRALTRPEAPEAGGRYGRLFGDLEPLLVDEQALHELGRAGGWCDSPGDDGREDAVWPFFGQFIAHDITADRSPVTGTSDPDHLRNARSPRANLESLYGGGPIGSPYLYDRDNPDLMLLGDDGKDVSRNAKGIALLGDPRNDVHLFVSQMHVAFLHLHNAFAAEHGFDEARRLATWHYQWIVLEDFLPRLLPEGLARELLDEGPRHFSPDGDAWIPVEFADAAFRYGHGQIRDAYVVCAGAEPVPLFPDLMGFAPVRAEHRVDWDGHLPGSLIALPHEVSGEEPGADYGSLAVRDLQRGVLTALPSGEAVARAMGEEPLSPEECGLAAGGWTGETPLWLYVLREAAARGGGDRLGPVGGRIVGEVLVGIVDADPESYRAREPGWTPGRSFGLQDVLLG